MCLIILLLRTNKAKREQKYVMNIFPTNTLGRWAFVCLKCLFFMFFFQFRQWNPLYKFCVWMCAWTRLSQIQNAYASLERAHILPHPGKCFKLKSCEVAITKKSRLFCPSQDTTNSLVTPPALCPFIIILCSTVSLPMSLLCLGSFSGQLALMFCLVRLQSPKGKSVLYK